MNRSAQTGIVLALLTFALAMACHGGGGGSGPAAGFTVTPTSGLVTTEAGGTDTFTVVLMRRPTRDVTVGLSSSNPAEGTVAPASLTFTAVNWNTPQTVTVTGVDDSTDDGDVAYRIVIAAAVSTDAAYNGLDPADVTAINTNDDTAGVTVTPTSGLFTSESGGTAKFTVALDTLPTADVTIAVGSLDTLEGTVSPTSLTFTSVDGMTPQTVTITGVDDGNNPDGPVAFTIQLAPAASADPKYNGMDPADVSVTNNDNDSPGITITPTLGLTTTEAGGTATFSIACNSTPAANVTISITSSNPAEGTPSTALLTFTPANATTPQIVTITGVDDAVDDGDVAYTIVTGNTSSTDASYNGLVIPDVSVTNQNDDTAGATVVQDGPFDPVTGELLTTESGDSATFEVFLNSQPTADVTIQLSSSRPSEGTVSPSSLTFTSADWDTSQVVTVTGVDDPAADGNQAYSIVTAQATSADPKYSLVNADDVPCVNEDDDTPGVFISPLAGLITTESGGTDTCSIHLTSIPTADVVINLSSSNPLEGTVSPSSLTFTPANALVPQVVTVTGVDDLALDGAQPYSIVTSTCVSTDPAYAAIDPSDVGCTNEDNENSPPGAGPFTKDAANPVLTTGAGSAFDAGQVSDPSVLLNGTFTMWYQGRNQTGRRHERIGRATSPDGTTWTKTGVVFSQSGVNGTFDRDGVMQPCVVFDGATTYRMWYTGRWGNRPGKIGLATSSNGTTWTRANGSNPVLVGTAGKFDSNGVSNPHVIFEGGVFKMWYTGSDATGVLRVGYAQSADGIAWVKQNSGNAVLTTSASGFDAAGVSACAVLHDAGTYRMWFAGLNSVSGGRLRIGYADSSDGIAWTKFVSNPVLTQGVAGRFDASQVTSPFVILDAGLFKMWYTGQDAASTNRIGYATSP